MIVHLIDGTYELFRHFYGLRRFNKGVDKPFGAVVGVLSGVLRMIEDGETYIGVATDQVIESFRNRLWEDYKTGEGIEPALLGQNPRQRRRCPTSGRDRASSHRPRWHRPGQPESDVPVRGGS